MTKLAMNFHRRSNNCMAFRVFYHFKICGNLWKSVDKELLDKFF